MISVDVAPGVALVDTLTEGAVEGKMGDCEVVCSLTAALVVPEVAVCWGLIAVVVTIA